MVMISVTSVAAQAAAEVTVTDWGNSYSLTDSITNAGEYYPSTLENELPATATASISGLTSTDTWRLMASTTMIGINIAVQCSGQGTSGDGSVSGCNDYKTLTSSEQEIFSGTGNPANIPLKFKLPNFDVTDGTGTKNIEIQYHVVTP